MTIECDQHDTASRWVLYHGTSTYRLKEILRENRLLLPPAGDQKISLTTERSVAEYFACNAVFGDHQGHPDEESKPVLLVLDGAGLLALQYELERFSDPIWGDGECDWENEIACWTDIDPLDEVLIEIEHLSEERSQPYLERRREPYKPIGPRLAEYELSLMEHMVGRLEEGHITADKADAIAAAINALRVMVRSDAARPLG